MKVWFQNRRIKWRKHHLEITQQRLALIRQRQITNPGILPPPPPAPTSVPQQESDLSVCTDSMDTSESHDVDDS